MFGLWNSYILNTKQIFPEVDRCAVVSDRPVICQLKSCLGWGSVFVHGVQNAKLHLFKDHILKFSSIRPLERGGRDRGRKKNIFFVQKSHCFVSSEITWHKAAALFFSFYDMTAELW